MGSRAMPERPFFSASDSEKYSYVLAPTLRVLRHLNVSSDAGAALILDLLAIRQATGKRQPCLANSRPGAGAPASHWPRGEPRSYKAVLICSAGRGKAS